MSEKLIIDTDPGIDDAMAILLAHFSPQTQILGLTTVFGNVSVAQATDNAAILRALVDGQFDIARGAGQALVRAPSAYPDFVHGSNGFGDIARSVPEYQCHELDAADYIIEMTRRYPGEITLVPLAPLTNIALALERDPSLVERVKSVVIMGGAARTEGNVSPVSEANIFGDPHAAQKVFAASWPVVMVGLDVTHQVVMGAERMQAIRDNAPKCGGFLDDICAFYSAFYRRARGVDGFCIHDPATVAYVINPDLFSCQTGMVEVALDGAAQGQTVFAQEGAQYGDHWARRNNVRVCMGVDAQGVLDLIAQTLKVAP